MLTKDNLLLRPPTNSNLDVSFLADLRNDPSVAHQLINRALPSNPLTIYKWINRKCKDPHEEFLFIIETSSDEGSKVLSGYATYKIIDQTSRVAMLGICLEKSSQNKGYGNIAVCLMIDYLYNTLAIRKFVFESLLSNKASRKLFANLGFREVGIFASHFLSHGAFHDIVLGELILSETNN